jgi:GxxExxY protein
MNGDKDPQTYAIIGAAMEVHRELGGGFLESVYQDALAVEFVARNIPFERERLCPVRYKGGLLPSHYVADFVCFGEIIVELKVLKALSTADDAQVLNYLKCTGFHRAILLNFGAPSLQPKRFVLGSEKVETPHSSVF